jgi:hypothetical protein
MSHTRDWSRNSQPFQLPTVELSSRHSRRAKSDVEGCAVRSAVSDRTGREGPARHDEGGRCTLVSGDFFESVPSGGDAYILKYILHNWDDEHSVKILANCCAAMNGKGRILIADPVIASENCREWGKLLDIQMMVVLQGKERTRQEFSQLFKKARLKLVRVVPTRSALSIVEGIRA